MENVTEGTNTTGKTDETPRDEAVCSNGEEGSKGGEDASASGDAEVTPSSRPSLFTGFRLRPPVTGVSTTSSPIQPPRITFDPPKLVLPPGSESPPRGDVSSSKMVVGGGGFGASSFGSNRAFKLNPPKLSNPFAKTGGDDEPTVNSSESGGSEDKTHANVTVTSSPSPAAAVSFVPLATSNSSTVGGGSGPPSGGDGGGGGGGSSDVSSTMAADSTTAAATTTSNSPSSSVVNSNATVAATTAAVASTSASSSTNSADNSSTTTTSASSSSYFSFVFGQNIRDKVEVVATAASDANEPSSTTPDTKEVTANGTSTSEMLFSAQVKNTDKANDSGGKTLSEAAREYEEARNVKRKFDEVPVLTGEEEEANVLQINCKLFAWHNNSWTERGRGTLRVNDFPNIPSQHRLIVRTAGSLRVVLNTKIWSGMTVDRASAKSMRITAMDSSGLVKVFLVMAGSKEMDQLQKCLDWRVNNLKKQGDPTVVKKTKTDDPQVTDKS